MRNKQQVKKMFSRLFIATMFNIFIFGHSYAQLNAVRPLPDVPQHPIEYRYPSLICGLPFPAFSASAKDNLQSLYKTCLTKECYRNCTNDKRDNTRGRLCENLVYTTLTGPIEFMKQYYNASWGYLVYCAFFGNNDELVYVTCTYTNDLNANNNQCLPKSPVNGRKGHIFGLNNASFSFEWRRIPALSDQYEYVRDFRFYPGEEIWTPEFIEGPEKTKIRETLDCTSISPTYTVSEPLTPSQPLSETLTQQQTATADESASATQSLEQTLSKPDVVSESPSVPVSGTVSEAETISSSTTMSQEVPATPTVVEDNKCWHHSTGVYNDTTAQPGRYELDDTYGVVYDKYTCLWWQRNISTQKMNWTEASDYCDGLELGGHNDWYLPNVMELQSLADYTVDNYFTNIPGINTTIFPNTPNAKFWSSVINAGNNMKSWTVDYGKANYIVSYSRPEIFYTRCTRSIINISVDERFDNISTVAVVKDKFTGLEWERDVNVTSDWYTAGTICRNQTTGNFNNWRLPTIKELSTIVNYKMRDLAMDRVFLGGIAHQSYSWSSTLYVNKWVFVLKFDWGIVTVISENSIIVWVRCCRP